VLIVTKRARADANTTWAQGGISAVLDPTDTFEAHVADTAHGGRGALQARHRGAVRARRPPDRIADLVALGTRFTARSTPTGNEPFRARREGGSTTARRVVHAGDITGREVERALLEAAEAHPRIRCWSSTWRST
jgi:L-aspartate oxidase